MKTFFSMLLGLLLLTGISVDGVSAQAGPKIIKQGVVNGKATSLPKPEYPDALRDAGIDGIVAVTVTIDETGAVIQAEADLVDQRVRKAEDGTVLEPGVVDPQLRAAAETAARGAKFAPTILSGVAVRVTGQIVYNFSATRRSEAEAERSLGLGVLNGKATLFPLPKYPAAAKAVNASGSVVVQVSIDETGRVLAASAVSGHPLLRTASETAAREALFAPTVVNGQAVKVSGVVVYNFVP